ncbi:hypothetical protein NA57DRAFT_58481 [Rhizodiscina lignyota]|uniref:Mediator of RNA polymerase II transcription subunit 1 n=1 Tax=Rhizodiscina lignyota TaxID=1504668 RepID=A0A9P4IBB9_9PEZI|nr:hypothetical protein NA57DRAFT_58481 [Rhizodiscina lignyota]
MATPTPSGTHGSKHPLTAHSTATPPSVSHLPNFSSPAPRSVPSPATHRNQAGKSPFNTSSHAPNSVGSTATAGAQNHPTGSSGKGSQGVAGGLLGSSPAGMNIDSPAALAMGLGQMGGVEMGLGMSMSGISQMGFGNLGMGMEIGGSRGVQGRAMDDEERRKRLEQVIAMVGSRPGRVSEESLERLGRRLGLDTQCDPPLGQGKGANWNGVRQLAIAGQTFVVDISSRSDSVENVSITWGADPTKVDESASKLLMESITPPPGGSSITYTLDKFEKNLERLARLDKLEGASFNCYEAITGVYESLKRLYEHEKKTALALIGEGANRREERAERETMCKKSGIPRLNAHGRIGVSLEYWMDGRFQFKSPSTDQGNTMDVDKPSSSSEHEDDGDGQVYSLVIDCESHPATLYTPIRTSTAWISEAVEKLSDDPHGLFGQQAEIDWQEPPSSYLNNPHEDAPQQPDPMNLQDLGMGKLPNIRFVARLDPPLPMPVQMWNSILHAVGVQPDLQSLRHHSYDGLVLRAESLEELAEARDIASQMERQVYSKRDILVPATNSKEEFERIHSSTLIAKAEFGKVLEEIPFSHPRDIVNILGVLRQYAFLNSLLKRSFAASNPSLTHGMTNGTSNGDLNGDTDKKLPSLPVDVLLTTATATSTSPQLVITFPRPIPPAPTPAPRSPVPSESKTLPSNTKRLVPYSSSTAASDADGDITLDDILDAEGASADPSFGAKDVEAEATVLSLTIEISAHNADVSIVEQNAVPPPTSAVTTNEKSSGSDGAEKQEGTETGVKQEGEDVMEGISKDMANQQEETKRLEKVQRFAKALEVCGDIDVWVEWIAKQS